MTVTVESPFKTITQLRDKLDEVHTFIHKVAPASKVDIVELRAGFDVAYARCGALLNRGMSMPVADLVNAISEFIATDKSLCEPSRVWLADVLAGDDIAQSFKTRQVAIWREWPDDEEHFIS